jgi:DNA-binding transcriptional regulator YiaG
VLVSPSSTRHFAASRLREAQAAAWLTNDTLAERVGVKVRLLQKWRAGTVAPSGGNLIALGRALDCHPEFFYVDGDSDMEPAA